MSRGGSYDPAATTAGGFTGEVARLAAQADLSFGEELRIFRELGMADLTPEEEHTVADNSAGAVHATADP